LKRCEITSRKLWGIFGILMVWPNILNR
jgi:hypothetical protein